MTVEVEPGDYLVKDAGLLLLGTTFVERKKNTLFVGADAGFSIAPEPAYYNLPFQPLPLAYDGGPCQQASVVGNINEALDVWRENHPMPPVHEGDIVAMINAGGYASAMSSNHCMRGSFREFLLPE